MSSFQDMVRLLPRGPAWDSRPDGPLGRRLLGAADEFDRVEASAAQLLEEATLNGAELLPEWEALTDSQRGFATDLASVATWLGLEAEEARRRLVALRLFPGGLTPLFCERFATLFPFTLLDVANAGAGAATISFAGRAASEADEIRPVLERRALAGAALTVVVDPQEATIAQPAPAATVADPIVVQGTAKYIARVVVTLIRDVDVGGDETQVAEAVPVADVYGVAFNASELGGDPLRFDGESALVRVEATNIWGQALPPVERTITQQTAAGIDVESGLTADHDEASAPFSVSANTDDFLVAIDLTIPATPSASPGLLFEVGEGRGLAVCIGDGSTGLIAHAAGQLVVGQAFSTNVGVSLLADLTPFAGQAGTLLVHLDPGNICRAAWQSGGVVTFLGSAPSTLTSFVDGGQGDWGQLAGMATQAAASVAAAPFVTGGRAYESEPLPASFPTS